MRWAGATFALVLFLLGTLASESVFARGGGRGGGPHGAGFHGGGHAGGFHGGKQFSPGGGFHGGKHFHPGGAFHGGKHFHHGGKHFHHGHGRIGVFIGAPLVLGGSAYTWPYYYPPYYYPSAPSYPPTYIEEGVPQQQPAPAYWYYCPDANAYYPYVKECPGGWQQVAPQPPPS
jgi:hypothetical protein